MEEGVRAHVLINGNVQGVGFRAFTRHHALQSHLQGWVRNRDDGGVEVEIEGPKSSVDAFLEVIHQGPPLGEVHHVTVDWKEPNRHTDGFQILPSLSQ